MNILRLPPLLCSSGLVVKAEKRRSTFCFTPPPPPFTSNQTLFDAAEKGFPCHQTLSTTKYLFADGEQFAFNPTFVKTYQCLSVCDIIPKKSDDYQRVRKTKSTRILAAIAIDRQNFEKSNDLGMGLIIS